MNRRPRGSRLILIDREAGKPAKVRYDTGFNWNGAPMNIPGLTPVKAAGQFANYDCTDLYPYRYRTVGRRHPKAVFDIYRAWPGFPHAKPDTPVEEVRLRCEYVCTVRRVLPRCDLCRKPMSEDHYGIDGGWLYAHQRGLDETWGDSCCKACFAKKVKPARAQAMRKAEERDARRERERLKQKAREV